jgi:hypothetical protein
MSAPEQPLLQAQDNDVAWKKLIAARGAFTLNGTDDL